MNNEFGFGLVWFRKINKNGHIGLWKEQKMFLFCARHVGLKSCPHVNEL